MHGKQKLNLFSFTMIVVGLVIGMGIFRSAATSAKDAIDPSVYFTAWLLGGFIALCGALTYAEIGSRYPVTGGYYKIFSYAYHPSIAFAINSIILISNAASLSAVALIGSGYVTRLLPGTWTDIDKALISCAAILIFYLINLRGLRMSSRAQNILMLLKIGLIVVLIGALFFPHDAAEATTAAVTTTATPSMSWIQSLGISLIAVSFTYGGYQQTINFGNEVDRPAKNIPRGIFIGIAIIIVLYLLVNLSYYTIVGFDNMKGEREIAYVVINKTFGKNAADLLSFFLFFGVLAYVNALLMSNPRVMYAMSTEGVLPKAFSRQNPKNEVLTVSLTVFAALCIVILFFAQTFEKILNFTIFLDCFGMVASSATIFVLRKRTKHLDGTGIYKMKFYPVLPLIFMAAYMFVGISITIQTPMIAVIGLSVLAGFMILYFMVRGRNAGPVNTDTLSGAE
ncbi:APC family permease [Sediminibacterium roseum]|uniref:APC family permease n=1 Tax=Sediminibacterium roseum TaxID=1978412 RepID=A0ABW9ZVB2_9BACT|nr:APC family permease [Sediminibacterium roseum]NCI48801.1 APC family permease [Sediminibacterium roseum]